MTDIADIPTLRYELYRAEEPEDRLNEAIALLLDDYKRRNLLAGNPHAREPVWEYSINDDRGHQVMRSNMIPNYTGDLGDALRFVSRKIGSQGAYCFLASAAVELSKSGEAPRRLEFSLARCFLLLSFTAVEPAR